MLYSREKLAQILQQLQVPLSIWVAYSGGLDSHVLLHSITNLRSLWPELVVRVIHIDHGLSPHAMEWSEHCQNVCKQLKVECFTKTVDVKTAAKNRSVEETARFLRYQVFKEMLQQGEALLTGHTLDDQAETVLLQQLRGTGLKGIAAMPEQKTLGEGILFRPLLTISRSSLHDYATLHQLQWIEDESNLSLQFDRNYLRHCVLPSVIDRWPAAKKLLARTAKHSAEASQLLDELAEQDLAVAAGPHANQLSISSVKSFSINRQKNLLRKWFRDLGLQAPSTIKLQHILNDVLNSSDDAAPLIEWKGVEVRRYQGYLYALTPLEAHDPSQVIVWNMEQPLRLPGNLGILKTLPSAVGPQLPDNISITIRFRQGGERFHPFGRIGSHPLKKLFQEWKIPPWVRDRIPLLYLDEELIAVPGYARGQVLNPTFIFDEDVIAIFSKSQ